MFLYASDSNMTVKNREFRPLRTEKTDSTLHLLKTIAFTHKHTPLKDLNRFFLHEENRKARLEYLRYSCEISEILYVSTCNRIEFIFTTDHDCDRNFLQKFFRHFRDDWSKEEVEFAIRHSEVYEGEQALRHIYRVASSLDSLVVGEREIITQVRKSYDTCKSEGLTGDVLRLVIKSTVTTAKQIYTETKIANNPVSVVSLAERKLREFNLDKNSRILLIGSGETNTNLAKYLTKQGFKKFTIFNRTIENAQTLCKLIATAEISATAHPLNRLNEYTGGFDVLVTCTGSAEKLITADVYEHLLQGETTEKVIVDLSVPSNIDQSVLDRKDIRLIEIADLKSIAESNLIERQKEFIAAEKLIDENVAAFHQMYRTRTLELKMKDVPGKIREIKDKAVNDIFAAEINSLDETSKEVLRKVLDYMEKKCISVPMVMAKEIILDKAN